jgi:predicted transcriptional regulator of viral defense system
MPKHDTYQRAQAIFRKHAGTLRTNEALKDGIHPRTLYAMRDAGLVEMLSRGLYRLANLPPLAHPDLIVVAKRVPYGVVCLISALAIHEITTQVPHEVYIAIPRGARPPRIDHPPVRAFRFSEPTFSAGIERMKMDDMLLKVYCPEKTLVDCFRHRNTIGVDVVIEALRLYGERKPIRISELLRFSRICGVEHSMRPYLEALL